MPSINYTTVMDVITTWDRLKQVPHYEQRAGDLIFARLFQIEPSARMLFGFTEEDDLRSHPKFATHAKAMVNMMDCAVAFLGPDLDLLRHDLMVLGKRHATHYGVSDFYLPVMGKAVIYALEEVLGEDGFTRENRRSWQDLFRYMTMQMAEGMRGN